MSRICVIRHAYYPRNSRVPKEVRALCEAGYCVDVVCLRYKGEKTRENVQGVQVYRLPHEHRRGSLGGYLYEYLFCFLQMFALVTVLFFWHRYKCIQVHTLPDHLVFVTIIPRLLGAKVLLDMHEPTPELFLAKYGPNKHRWVAKLMVLSEQVSLKYATAVLTVNESIRDKFVERGARREKIYIVRNVPDETLCAGMSDRSRNSSLRLLTHGLIAERYGQETIIRALLLVRDKIKNLHLVIAGYGENEENLRRLTRELGCSDIVTFTGRVPFSGILELIASTDIGVVPLLRSPFSELCQPNKLFEFIACKKPVIASRLKAIEESFDDTCAMFFEPGNEKDLARCIMDLYQNPKKRLYLAENAYRRFQTMCWKESKKTYLQVVNKLSGNSRE
jgi:glycosyltransferase involved in cell wall biosynthesis